MHKKLRRAGIVIIIIGLLVVFFGFLFSKRFFLFDYNVLLTNSKSILISGLLLFILGAVLVIMGFVLKDELPQPEPQKEEREIYSGVCPVCHQEFKTYAEIKNGYYVFNCNRCNSRLRVKKSTFYPAG